MKALFIIFLLLFVVSCSHPGAALLAPEPEKTNDPYLLAFGKNPLGYKYQELPLEEAWPIVASMKYIPEDGDYWKSPKEFFADGGGDCEDFTSALMYLLGADSWAVLINAIPRGHYIVLYRGQYIEPQRINTFFNETKITIVEKYRYDYALSWATAYGTK